MASRFVENSRVEMGLSPGSTRGDIPRVMYEINPSLYHPDGVKIRYLVTAVLVRENKVTSTRYCTL